MAKDINEVLGIIKSDKSYNILQVKRDLGEVIEVQKVELSKKEGKKTLKSKPAAHIEDAPKYDNEGNLIVKPVSSSSSSIPSPSPEILEEEPSLNRDKVKVVAQGINNLEDLALFEMTLRVLFPDVINEEMATFFEENYKEKAYKVADRKKPAIEVEKSYDLKRVEQLELLDPNVNQALKDEIESVFKGYDNSIKTALDGIGAATEQVAIINNTRYSQRIILERIVEAYFYIGNELKGNKIGNDFQIVDNNIQLKDRENFSFEKVISNIFKDCGNRKFKIDGEVKPLLDIIVEVINSNKERIGCKVVQVDSSYQLQPVGFGYSKNALSKATLSNQRFIDVGQENIKNFYIINNIKRKQIIDEATVPVREACQKRVEKAEEVEKTVIALSKKIKDQIEAVKEAESSIAKSSKAMDDTFLEAQKVDEAFKDNPEDARLRTTLKELSKVDELVDSYNNHKEELNKAVENLDKARQQLSELWEELETISFEANTDKSAKFIWDARQNVVRSLLEAKSEDNINQFSVGQKEDLLAIQNRVNQATKDIDDYNQLSGQLQGLEAKIQSYTLQKSNPSGNFGEKITPDSLYKLHANLVKEAARYGNDEKVVGDSTQWVESSNSFKREYAERLQIELDLLHSLIEAVESVSYPVQGQLEANGDSKLKVAISDRADISEFFIAYNQLKFFYESIDKIEDYDEILGLYQLINAFIHGTKRPERYRVDSLEEQIEENKKLIKKNLDLIHESMAKKVFEIFIHKNISNDIQSEVIGNNLWLAKLGNQIQQTVNNEVLNINLAVSAILEGAGLSNKGGSTIRETTKNLEKVLARGERDEAIEKLKNQIHDIKHYKVLLELHHRIMTEPHLKYIYTTFNPVSKTTKNRGRINIPCSNAWLDFEKTLIDKLIKLIPNEILSDAGRLRHIIQQNPFLENHEIIKNNLNKDGKIKLDPSLIEEEITTGIAIDFKAFPEEDKKGKESGLQEKEHNIKTDKNIQAIFEQHDSKKSSVEVTDDSEGTVDLNSISKKSPFELSRKCEIKVIENFVNKQTDPNEILELHATIMASKKYGYLYKGKDATTLKRTDKFLFTLCNQDWYELEKQMIVKVIDLWAKQDSKMTSQAIDDVCKANPFLQKYDIQKIYQTALRRRNPEKGKQADQMAGDVEININQQNKEEHFDLTLLDDESEVDSVVDDGQLNESEEPKVAPTLNSDTQLTEEEKKLQEELQKRLEELADNNSTFSLEESETCIKDRAENKEEIMSKDDLWIASLVEGASGSSNMTQQECQIKKLKEVIDKQEGQEGLRTLEKLETAIQKSQKFRDFNNEEFIGPQGLLKTKMIHLRNEQRNRNFDKTKAKYLERQAEQGRPPSSLSFENQLISTFRRVTTSDNEPQSESVKKVRENAQPHKRAAETIKRKGNRFFKKGEEKLNEVGSGVCDAVEGISDGAVSLHSQKSTSINSGTRRLHAEARGYKSNMEKAVGNTRRKKDTSQSEPKPHFGPGEINNNANSKTEKKKGKESQPYDRV
ncbi:hypothetical protein L3V86_07825 [Thiotrichales bacterium 19S11-10]|nr:hypothetical protein [Thiotrichales bacterium 19S11-10]